MSVARASEFIDPVVFGGPMMVFGEVRYINPVARASEFIDVLLWVNATPEYHPHPLYRIPRSNLYDFNSILDFESHVRRLLGQIGQRCPFDFIFKFQRKVSAEDLANQFVNIPTTYMTTRLKKKNPEF